MELDLKLTKLGLKIKNFVVLDLSFPAARFPEFKSAYEKRYIHMPCKQESALGFAAGLASLGKIVAIFGAEFECCDLPDQTLNVKLLKEDAEAVWDYLEDEVLSFGPAVLLIPEQD